MVPLLLNLKHESNFLWQSQRISDRTKIVEICIKLKTRQEFIHHSCQSIDNGAKGLCCNHLIRMQNVKAFRYLVAFAMCMYMQIL